MKIIVKANYQDVSREAARIVARQVLLKPNSVLGLPTGETPIGMYAELAKMYDSGLVEFSSVTTFNLDEYYQISPDHPLSYHRYMRERFFSRVDIDVQQTHIPNGSTNDPQEECRNYAAAIEQYGQIDLQVLGIGTNGHIGFNEPGTPWEITVGLVSLSDETRRREVIKFGSLDSVPRQAITMGIKAIMNSRRILLLAVGIEKAQAIARALTGPITLNMPASALQLHPDVTVVIDREASAFLSFQ